MAEIDIRLGKADDSLAVDHVGRRYRDEPRVTAVALGQVAAKIEIGFTDLVRDMDDKAQLQCQTVIDIDQDFPVQVKLPPKRLRLAAGLAGHRHEGRAK